MLYDSIVKDNMIWSYDSTDTFAIHFAVHVAGRLCAGGQGACPVKCRFYWVCLKQSGGIWEFPEMGVPSGKLTINYGKSQFLMGKFTINGNFQ